MYCPDRMLDPKEDNRPDPVCPFCARVCETMYYDLDGVIFACDLCVKTNPAEMERDCFPHYGGMRLP